MKRLSIQLLAGAVFIAAAGITAFGSSHREAPGITGRPKLDGTDFYAFRSYEPGREGYVTLIANYIPLQDAYGGPNFFAMDPNGLYEIHVDNNGDAKEDVTFQFRFKTTYRNLAVDAGGRSVTVPLVNIGPIGPNAGDNANLNALETYQVTMVRGPRRGNPGVFLRDAATNSRIFRKPADRIGDKSIPNYAQYAETHIYNVTIPGCGNGRVFVGPAARGLRGEPGRGVRPDQPEPARAGRRDRERARRQERDEPGARSTDRVPDGRRRPGDRRVDDGQRACRSATTRTATTTAKRGGRCRASDTRS